MAEPALADRLRGLTPARVQIGRVGSAMTTSALLAFQLDHARARDAVAAAFDTAGLSQALGREIIEVRSMARDRREYLSRPDLGRQLASEDAAVLPAGRADLALVIADGLSANAVHAHAAPVAAAILQRLEGWTIAPIVAARQARVALGDAIGAALGADLVCVLIGERPGLSTPGSLGAYLTWNPKPGRRDSERNCVSNIHPPDGLSYEIAADTIARLLRAARQRRLTGLLLKDGNEALGAVAPAIR